jgi:exosortase/archaeosortase family protein
MLGAALLLGGWRTLRSILRPTLFLLFAVPIPAFVVNQVVVPMQFGTANLATGFLSLLGFDVIQRADLIYARDHVFQVIESCSGLRFVVTLAMAAVAYTEIFNLHRLHAGLLIAASPIFAFLLNGVRVLTIVLSAGTVPGAEDHTIQGLVMIVIGVLLLAPLDTALGRWLPERFRTKRRESRANTAVSLPLLPWRVATVISALALLVVASRAVVPWSAPVGIPPWGVPLPRSWGEYESRALTIDPNFLGSLRFSKKVARAYEHGDERVEVFIGYDDLTNRSTSPFSPRLPHPSSGWHVESTSTVSLDGFPVRVRSTLLGRDARTALSYTWYEDARGPWAELARAVVGVGRSSARGSVGVTAVRLTTPVEAATGGIESANQRLRRFASELRPKLIEATGRISSAIAQQKHDGSTG